MGCEESLQLSSPGTACCVAAFISNEYGDNCVVVVGCCKRGLRRVGQSLLLGCLGCCRGLWAAFDKLFWKCEEEASD